MFRRWTSIAGIGVLLLLPACARTQTESSTQSADAKAKSVILLIGDGMDDHQIAIARNYLHGASGSMSFEEMPVRGAARVLTVLETDPTVPEYVADSANSGTTLSTGVVTSRGRIATTASSDQDVETILEKAQKAGLGTGVVTTSSVTDATPATFMAHVAVRWCEGPDDMDGSRGGLLPGCPNDLVAAGGRGSIAEQLVERRVTVLLGGGLEHFEQRAENGEVLLERARSSGIRVVQSADSLAALKPGAPVLGLFGNGTLPVVWAGEGGRSAAPVKGDLEAFRCVDNPRFGDLPRLAEMTAKAIELLSFEGRGFFLLVESASIDKQAHGANPCGEIGETLQLEEAVAVAREYAAVAGDTMIVVTADHGHAGQIIPYPSLFEGLSSILGPQGSPGKVALLATPEGGRMAVSYGTNSSRLEEHTGTHVPVFAEGPGAAVLAGLVSQHEIFFAMVRALDLD